MTTLDGSMSLAISNRMGGKGRTSVVARHIRTLNASTAYATDAEGIVLEIGDSYELTFVTGVSGVLQSLVAGFVDFDAADLLQLTSCTAEVDGASVADGASIAAYQDSKIHTLKITATAPITISILGQNGSGANFFGGELLGDAWTISGVRETRPWDSASLVFQQAKGHGLGSELVDDGTFQDWTGDDPDDWPVSNEDASNYITEHVDGARIVSNNTANVNMAQTTTLTFAVGHYMASFTKNNHTAGEIRYSVFGGTATLAANIGPINYAGSDANGSYDVVFEVTVAGTVVFTVNRDNTGPTDYVMNEISSREIPKAIVYSNFIDSDIEQFTYNQQAVRWEGVDRIVNGGFDADTDWTLTDPALTISGGRLHCDGTQTGTETAYQNISAYFNDGERCLFTYSVAARTAGQSRPRINATFGTYESTVGIHSEALTGASWTVVGPGVDVDFIGSIDNVFVKRVLEYN